MKIPLVRDPIPNSHIDELIKWLGEYPFLSQGKLVEQFENEFAKWQGKKYAVMVNSGSSAVMAMAYFYRLQELKNNRVILPALSWSTSIAPWIQFGFSPYLVDCNKENLGPKLEHLEHLFKTLNPAILMTVNVLGFPCDYKEIVELCEKYDVKLIVDDCEDSGSEYNFTHAGNYGEIVCKSFFASHLLCTVEGGMCLTDDEYTCNMLKMIREHGWDRRVKSEFSNYLKKEFLINEFNENFTFYVPGFNIRSTEINAFLGLKAMKTLPYDVASRKIIFENYQEKIVNDHWKPSPKGDFISCFAYPIITSTPEKRMQLVKILKEKEIDCRPLIAGNIANHPMWVNYGSGEVVLPNADKVHECGLYIPAYSSLTVMEQDYICDSVNEGLK